MIETKSIDHTYISNVNNVIIFGAGGMIGRNLKKLIKDGNVSIFTKNTFNVYKKYIENTIKNDLEHIIAKDDIVINCIGMNSLKTMNEKVKEFIIVNSVWPKILSSFCQNVGANMIHISTDKVFKDNKMDMTPESIVNTDNIYGLTKFVGECSDTAIIRTSIIGENNNGRGIIEWAKRNDNRVVFADKGLVWNGVTSFDISKYIFDVISGEKPFWKGVKHLSSFKEPITKFELLKHISDVYELNLTVINGNNITKKRDEYIILKDCEVITENFRESLKK